MKKVKAFIQQPNSNQNRNQPQPQNQVQVQGSSAWYIPCTCAIDPEGKNSCMCQSQCDLTGTILCKCCLAPDGKCYECNSIPNCAETAECSFNAKSGSEWGTCQCGKPLNPSPSPEQTPDHKKKIGIMTWVLIGLFSVIVIGVLIAFLVGMRK